MQDLSFVRSQFPSLSQVHEGRPVVYFDNPGGTQVPRSVIDAMGDYLVRNNANHGGAFPTSERSDAMIEEARRAVADLLGAAGPQEIVFGPNMTTLTFGLSRGLGQWIRPGDEIIVTRLDHDANITPWVLLARDAGAVIRWIDIDPGDCTLRLRDLERQLSARTRIVAVGYASNSAGTVNDVATIISMAHRSGALVFVDAVHYAPHGPIDVQGLGCDFLACSAYKFFGPHVGVLYGKFDLLDRLPAYKVRPAPDRPPHKFETGTQNHEGIAGTLAAVEYLASLAEGGPFPDRRGRLVGAMNRIRDYEQILCNDLLSGLLGVKGVHVYGITDPARMRERVPTVSFRLEGFSPRQVAEHLGGRGIFVWHGNYYALSLSERLGVEEEGGMVRVGLAHYNTAGEIERLIEYLQDLTSS
ncbi:MAG: cysteine desulfurase-like protein [Thermodesulfobacteriota bacterium]